MPPIAMELAQMHEAMERVRTRDAELELVARELAAQVLRLRQDATQKQIVEARLRTELDDVRRQLAHVRQQLPPQHRRTA